MSEELKARVAALLRSFEWADEDDRCPECGLWPSSGHHVSCELAAVLAELEALK